MKKQTAVEWLLTYLPQIDYGNDPYYKDIINQAKEIEKQQIINTFYDCKLSIIIKEPITADQYYTENYESNR